MKNINPLIYLLAFVKFALPFVLQDTFYQPHRDEFLYLAEGIHLDWGFMEVPPALSVLAWFTHLLGNGFFWVKFWPSLFGALTYVLSARIIVSLGGGLYALFLTFLAFIFGAYLRVHYLFQPNFLEIFFYTLVAFAVIRFIQTQKNKFLYLFGIACGLGLMSKYSIAFFIAGVIVGLALSNQRTIFTNRHFYFSLLIAAVIFLPNAIWQYNHNFPVARHMQELQRTQLQYISPSDFIKGQLLMNLPCVFVWIVGLLFVVLSKKGRQYIFIFWAYLILIVLLITFHGKDYYALGIYPTLFAFGAYLLERLTRKRVPFMRWVFLTFAFYFGVISIPIALPIFPPKKLADLYRDKGAAKIGVLKWEDHRNHALPQDFADMIGWKEIAEKTARVYKDLSEEDRKKTIIKCDNYGLCGALNFYGKELGLPEVYSSNASFLFWMPETYNVTNVITVGEGLPDTTRPIIKQFATIMVKDELNDTFARENGAKIILLEHANTVILSNFLQAEVAQKKSNFIKN